MATDDGTSLAVLRGGKSNRRRRHPGRTVNNLTGDGNISRFMIAGLLVFAVTLLFYGPMLAAHVHVNIWWFESVQLGRVYGRTWNTERNLFLLFGALTYLSLTGIFVATRALTYRPNGDANARAVDRLLSLVTGLVVGLVTLVTAHVMASQWDTYFLSAHSKSFGISDPVHHRDIGFYVFTMPWRETLAAYVGVMLVLSAVELAGLATLYTVTSPLETKAADIRRVASIASLFAAILFLFLAWRNFYLNPYILTRPGTAYGGGATFVHASLWWFPIVGVVEVVTALGLLVNVRLGRVRLTAIAALPLIVGVAASAGQGIFQRFVVAPNELSAEFRYLGYTLNFTRQAYGISNWTTREYTPRALTQADVTLNKPTVNDARIADAGAVTQVIRQRQENRTYYTFKNADIDRYTVGGTLRQVLLAARETEFDKLPAQAQTWVNEHLKFTHGFGLTMGPANTVTRDGQPVLWIQNVPVQETIRGLPAVRQPRIYFGESTNSWIITNATTPEFDSATADRDIAYRYRGPDGVLAGSGLTRLTLSWVLEGGIPFFNRLNISGYVRPSSKILLHRNILDRVETIAPWLEFDSDPYLVLRTDGSLVWIVDGMTHSDHYPYSEPTAGDNYRRNSVKITIDAYTGRPTFYAWDPHDPILAAWSSGFPGLIHPLSDMPADLRTHVKYPDDYLSWQADGFQRYHVTDVTSYYNGDNQWEIENTTTYNWNDGATETGTMAPIWTVARLFGEKRDAFFSLVPFSVRGKATMAGYVAADNSSYRVTALDMPRGAQTMGVTQFESLFNQAPGISSTLTLLDQHGSQVVPGQVVILPVGKALLYVKPLYLRSASVQSLPQLIRIVVGTQNAVNWDPSLKGAIRNLLVQGDISNVSQGSSASPTPSPVALPTGVQAGHYAKLTDARLIALATTYYEAAQRSPSLTEKDRDLREVGIILEVLHARHR